MSIDDLVDDAATSPACPSEAHILSFVEGSASDAGRAAIEVHLGRCEVCRQLVSALAPTSGPAGSAPSARVGAFTGDHADIIRVGATLAGKYRVVRILGQGGMGIVVEAHHDKLDRRVALKFLRRSLADNAEAVSRFFREARAAAALDSEHVVRVLDAGHLPETDEPYLALEFLEGRDLSNVLRDSAALPVADAVDYVLQAAEALCLAHARGIVHRDIKPANLFLTHRADGSPIVKVLDFGIAKVLEASPQALGQTSESAVLGSPRYMAPEQLQSSTGVDGRADVWALGVTLFELVAGEAPFEGTSVAMLCSKILTVEPAALVAVRSDVPTGLSEVVRRCLAKDPAERIPSMVDLVSALAPFASPEGRRAAERTQRVAKRPPGASTPPMATPKSATVGGHSTLSSAASSQAKIPSSIVGAKSGAGGLVIAAVAIASAAVAASTVWFLRDDADAMETTSPVVATTPAGASIERATTDLRSDSSPPAASGAPSSAPSAEIAIKPAGPPPGPGKPPPKVPDPPAPLPPASAPDPLHRDGLLDRK